MTRKLSIAALVILIIAGLMYSLAYFIFIPKTAMVLMPFKWRNILAGRKKESYYIYVGRSATVNDQDNYKGDTWIVKKGNYNFYLNINYNDDTVGKFVQIYYTFHTGLFYKKETLLLDSL